MSVKSLIEYWKYVLKNVDHRIKPPVIPYDEIEKELQGAGIISCELLHNGSCETNMLTVIIRVLLKSYKYFFVLHALPVILFKRRELKTHPWNVIKKRFILYLRSLCYLCFGFSTIFYVRCNLTRIFGSRINFTQPVPGKAFDFMGVFASMVSSSIGCLNILLEVESRQKEIFIFVLPRIVLTMWNFLKRRKIITHTLPLGENLLFGLGLGVVLDYIRKESPEVKSVIKSSLLFVTDFYKDMIKLTSASKVLLPVIFPVQQLSNFLSSKNEPAVFFVVKRHLFLKSRMTPESNFQTKKAGKPEPFEKTIKEQATAKTLEQVQKNLFFIRKNAAENTLKTADTQKSSAKIIKSCFEHLLTLDINDFGHPEILNFANLMFEMELLDPKNFQEQFQQHQNLIAPFLTSIPGRIDISIPLVVRILRILAKAQASPDVFEPFIKMALQKLTNEKVTNEPLILAIWSLKKLQINQQNLSILIELALQRVNSLNIIDLALLSRVLALSNDAKGMTRTFPRIEKLLKKQALKGNVSPRQLCDFLWAVTEFEYYAFDSSILKVLIQAIHEYRNAFEKPNDICVTLSRIVKVQVSEILYKEDNYQSMLEESTKTLVEKALRMFNSSNYKFNEKDLTGVFYTAIVCHVISDQNVEFLLKLLLKHFKEVHPLNLASCIHATSIHRPSLFAAHGAEFVNMLRKYPEKYTSQSCGYWAWILRETISNLNIGEDLLDLFIQKTFSNQEFFSAIETEQFFNLYTIMDKLKKIDQSSELWQNVCRYFLNINEEEMSPKKLFGFSLFLVRFSRIFKGSTTISEELFTKIKNISINTMRGFKLEMKTKGYGILLHELSCLIPANDEFWTKVIDWEELKNINTDSMDEAERLVLLQAVENLGDLEVLKAIQKKVWKQA